MRLIYKILKRLEQAMDEEEFSWREISHEILDITEARWTRLIQMMMEDGLIDGFDVSHYCGRTMPGIKALDPRVTLRGLEFLSENSAMIKLHRIAKGVRDVIPL